MTQALRIVLSTAGTTGDVEPYRVLGLALAERGHRVCVLSHDMHRAHFEAVGLEFRATAADVDRAAFNRAFDEILAKETDPVRQFMILVHDVLLRDLQAQLDAQTEAVADADLGVCHSLDYVGPEALRRRGVPWAAAYLLPEVIESSEGPPFPLPRLGRLFARAAWQAASARAKQARLGVEARLAQAGVRIDTLGIAGHLSPTLNLIAASPALVPARKDWPRSFHITGHWHRSGGAAAFDAELDRFLDANQTPVVVTFGSMGGERGAEAAERVGAALRKLDHPAVVQLGYQGLELRGPHIFSAGYVAHEPLFARAGVVVHHAGAGTSHAVSRAGVPSVAVPHMFDQYYWAGMLHRVGVAPKPLWRRSLEADALARAIQTALSDRGIRRKAKALGEQLRTEDGVGQAVRLIEGIKS